MIKKCFLAFLVLVFTLNIITVSALTLEYDGKKEDYKGRNVTLFVNGQEIETDMPAIIMNSRTRVPARAVFEALGAKVEWSEAEKKVTVSDKDTKIEMTVNSDVAFVNGEKKTLDAPAKIVNNRTLIPVRFPSEALGAEVSWDDGTATVFIDREEPSVSLKSVNTLYNDGYLYADITFGGEVFGVEDFTLDGGNPRIVVDIKGVKLYENFPKKEFENMTVKSLRCGQYQINPYVMRVVFDLEKLAEYEVSASGNTVSVKVKTEKKQVPEIEQKPVENIVWNDVLPTEKAKKLLVVIDPGHGGSDVGAIGKEGDKAVLYEKDVNLAVSLYIEEYLKAAGVKTYMMRTDDVAVALSDRPEIANDLNAALYLSVHSNSFKNHEVNGTTVLYYAAEKETGKFSGKTFANLLQKEMVSALGTYDRGLMDGSEMYVIRKTTMPSVIAEMAFISNPDDREKLASDQYRKKVAYGMARAVIKSLNMMAEE